MLGEATATTVMRQFHGELFHFDRFAQISKVGVPTYTTALNSEFLDVSNRFFDDIFTQGRGLKDILTSTTGYVGPGTAPLYGLTRAGERVRRRRISARSGSATSRRCRTWRFTGSTATPIRFTVASR